MTVEIYTTIDIRDKISKTKVCALFEVEKPIIFLSLLSLVKFYRNFFK